MKLIGIVLILILCALIPYVLELEWRKKRKTRQIKKSIARTCPRCGRKQNNIVFKCKNCGEWLDNDVFRKLEADDISKIKSEKLTFFTPSLIGLMLSETMQKELNELIKSKPNNLTQRFLFTTYCYSNALRSLAKKKKGKEAFLTNEIETILIKQALSLIEKRCSGPKFKPHAIDYGLNLFRELDKAFLEFRFDLMNPDAPSGFLTAQKIGEVINKGPLNIASNMKLFLEYTSTFKNFYRTFSEVFILEEDDCQ